MSTTHRRSEVTRRDFLATVAAALTLPRAAPPHARRLPQPTLAERLGYPADARLLIVHLDDLGLLHAVNAAAVVAFETGVANSGSLMVPCPWFAEAAAYARAHPQLIWGSISPSRARGRRIAGVPCSVPPPSPRSSTATATSPRRGTRRAASPLANSKRRG